MVCGYKMDLGKKLPPVLSHLAALTLGAFHNLRWRSRRGQPNSNYRFAIIERFGEEHDALWQRMAATSRCCVVRDASYLNWKYIDRPSRKFTCIEMRSAERLLGVAITMTADPNPTYNYQRGYLVDLVVPLDRSAYIIGLIDECIRVVKQQGAQTVTCHVANIIVEGVLQDLGFSAREPRHHLLVAIGPDSKGVSDILLRKDSWFVTLGDSDADAYAD